MSVLELFSDRTREWFTQAFEGPTPAQEQGWPAIASRRAHADPGAHRLGEDPGRVPVRDRPADRAPGEGLRLLYVSPLKALNYDVERNLRGPLAGLQSELNVAVRTGDTPAKERAAMLRRPPDILITTPESLFLLLTSQGREMLRSVETLILDEVHAVAGTKRGAHLALSVERLDRLVPQPVQRVGLSATQRPIEEIGRFVVRCPGRSGSSTPARGRSSTSASSCRSRTCASPAPALSPTRCSARAGRATRPRSGRRSTPSCCGSSRSTARRSCSSTTGGWPSGWRCG